MSSARRIKARAVLVLLLSLVAMPLWGVRAVSVPVDALQPDGSTVRICIHGDEAFSWKTTPSGWIVAQGADGYYYYADFDSGYLKVSGVRADSGTSGVAKTLPPQLRQIVASDGGRSLSVTAGISGNTRSSGEMKTLVIPVQFKDLRFTSPTPRNSIYNLFNQVNYSYDGATGSVRDYFRDNLGSLCNFTFDVCDPVTLEHVAAFYGENISGSTDVNIRQFVIQACMAANEAGVDFSRYDADLDGVVDNVFIIFAGHNEAEGGGDDCIWPQSWTIGESQLYLDGMKVSNFSCYSEYSGASGNDFAGIGPVCHEYCHFLGLKDMYDVNGADEGESAGLSGTLSVMDQGCYNNGCKTPPYINSVERDHLGILGLVPLSTPGLYEIPPLQESRVAYRFRTSYAEENFYIEYHDGVKWDAYAGGTGLVIYHVDRTTNQAGSMDAAMRWKMNAVNACAAHQCVRPVPATGSVPTDAADLFFPGRNNVTAILSSRNFPLLDWSARGVGYGITGITRTSRGMSFTVVEDRAWSLPSITDYSILPEQTSALFRWNTNKGLDGEWRLVWGARTSVEKDTLYLRGNSYDFANLQPGTDYYCSLTYLYSGVEGKTNEYEFQTARMLSAFPLIAGAGGVHKVGEEFRLRLHNVTEDMMSVRWYVNGALNSSGSFRFADEGNCTVKAVISYPDGSEEAIVKIIKVQATDEQTDTP